MLILLVLVRVPLVKERKRRGEANNQVFLPDILAYQVAHKCYCCKSRTGCIIGNLPLIPPVPPPPDPHRASSKRLQSCTSRVDSQRRCVHLCAHWAYAVTIMVKLIWCPLGGCAPMIACAWGRALIRNVPSQKKKKRVAVKAPSCRCVDACSWRGHAHIGTHALVKAMSVYTFVRTYSYIWTYPYKAMLVYGHTLIIWQCHRSTCLSWRRRWRCTQTCGSLTRPRSLW